MKPFEQPMSVKKVFVFIFKLMRSFPLAISIMVGVTLVWAVDLSLRSYLIKVIIDRVVESPAKDLYKHLLFPALAFILISFLMSTMFRLYGYFVEIKAIPVMRRKIANQVFAYLLNHSHHYYQNQFAGSLTNKINDLTSYIPQIIQIMIDRFLGNIFGLSIAMIMLWQVNYTFALAIFIWAATFILVSFSSLKRIHRLASDYSEMGSVITGNMVDILSNILSVRLFSRKRFEKDYMNGIFTKTVQAERKLQWTYFWIFVLYGYSFIILQGSVLYFLIQGRMAGNITPGDFALVLGINIAIVDFLWQLTKDMTQFTQLLGRVAQGLNTTTMPIEIEDKPGAARLQVPRGEISFANVQFYYKGAEPLFENKSVIIKPGEKVGLVGFSGSGKSTFVNLILRLFEVNHGAILIDNQNIREVTQDSLRESIGMIPQDPSLFHRTLLENIQYGQIDATLEEVIEAAQKAHAHEFIHVLPQGYDSMVGERGVKLSGGQRQRIAIARAILKNAPILILDEATSQLDSVTESYIQDSLWDLMQNKTTLIIAHRLSTLLQMDRILVFDKGKIVQDGTHDELLAQTGVYKTLWDAQVGGFLP